MTLLCRPSTRLQLWVAMKLLAIVLLLLGALQACAAQELALLTNINFKGVLAACLGEDPVAGNCPGSPYGPLSQWDTSRVTDMAGSWQDAAGNWLNGSASSRRRRRAREGDGGWGGVLLSCQLPGVRHHGWCPQRSVPCLES